MRLHTLFGERREGVMVCFISDVKPISYNNSDKKKKYQAKLQKRFDGYKKLYPYLPLEGELASRIVYIHKSKRGILDVDNLSKPFVDAFSGIIYKDDEQIRYRECSRISLEEMDCIEVNYAGMEKKAQQELHALISKEADDITYFEIDTFDYEMVKVGKKYGTER